MSLMLTYLYTFFLNYVQTAHITYCWLSVLKVHVYRTKNWSNVHVDIYINIFMEIC